MRWQEFAERCPEIAARGEERLRTSELCLVGTVRRDGYPRISPVEPDFVDGDLMLGMMWQSRKALDLLRDPRCVVHSVVSDKAGTEGDVKLYGRGLPVDDAARRERYRDVIRERTGWAPDEPNFHLFALDVESAGFVIFGDEKLGLTWDPDGGLRTWIPG